MILTKEMSKAARALLGITANELAGLAEVSQDTLRSFESGRSKTLSASNQESVRKTLEAQGIQFLDTGEVSVGPGVAMKGGKD